MFKLKALAPLAAGVGVAAVVALAPAAHATTGSCASIIGPHCGTFQGTDLEPTTPATPVFWNVKGGSATVGAMVIGYANRNSGDAASDITRVYHTGALPDGRGNETTISYSFVYSPGGKWSNLCVADPGTHVLVLRPCNGLQWQRFIVAPANVGTPPTRFPGDGNGVYVHSGDQVTLQNVAYNLFVQDEATVPPGVHQGTPDSRQLKDDGIGSDNLVRANQVWVWGNA